MYSYLCLSHGETEGVKDSVAVGSTAAVITESQSTIVVFIAIDSSDMLKHTTHVRNLRTSQKRVSTIISHTAIGQPR